MLETPYKIRFGRLPDPNIIAATLSRPNIFSDVWTFRCPEGVNVVLRAGDSISARIFAAAAEIAAPHAFVAVEARNPQNRLISRIYGPSNYLASTEFTDVKAKARFTLTAPVIITPKSFIVIMVRDDVAMTLADITTNSWGVIETNRIVLS